jgi:tetratricopeptide (TPR) repeat protein
VAVGLIIRICSLGLLIFVSAYPASAKLAPRSALSSYVQARMLDAGDDPSAAAQAYGIALSGAPDEPLVLERAYRRAIEAGDKLLAVRAAQSLDGRRKLTADARLLLFSESLAKGDWRGANLRLDQMEETGDFDFLVPVLRAWTRFAAREGDPFTTLELRSKDSLTSTYAREHRALLLLALKRTTEGFDETRASATNDLRGLSFRLAAAARLIQLKDRERALQLLDGSGRVAEAARTAIQSGKPLPGSIDSANKAVALLFARVSSDLIRDSASPASLTLARLGSFSGPPSDDVKIALARALTNNRRHAEALTVLDTASTGAVSEMVIRDLRIAILQRGDRNQEALVLAQLVVDRPGATATDFERLGEAFNRVDRPNDAAKAFGQAIALIDREGGTASAPWNLWLAYGGALDAAKDWRGARVALSKSVALAPDQPAALNHLGYAMLEHGESPDEAMRYIGKASALRPNDPAITDSLGWAFYLRGDTAQSIQILERAVTADPTIAELSEHLGDAYWSAGRRVDARYAWSAALVQAEEGSPTERLAQKILDGLPGKK